MTAEITVADPLEKPNAFEELAQYVTGRLYLAQDLKVTTQFGFDTISDLYKEAKSWEKRIDFWRKEANKPDQDKINARNDKAKELLDPLKEIISISKQKTQQYHLILEEQKKKEEERAKEAADLIGMETTPYVAPLEKTIRGDGATAYTRVVRKFRTTDISLVPLKYLQVNEEAVEEAIKLGIIEIPGIEITETKETILKSR